MAFDKAKFIEQFKSETREHLQKLNKGLLKLEKNPQDRELLELLMREAHTIKGSATMMGYKRIAEISHKLEDGFEKAFKKELKVEKGQFDVLFRGLDTIEPLLEDKLTWEARGLGRPYLEELLQEIDEVFSGQKSRRAQKAKKGSEEKGTALVSGAPVPVDASLRVDTGKLDRLMNLSGELLISKIRLKELVNGLVNKVESRDVTVEGMAELAKEMKVVNESIDFSSANMRDEVMGLRMVPISYLFNTFPRAMRDLANERGKDIELEIKGEDTHLDKGIIDQMKDPLMHLLRNAVDHGVEEPKERKEKKKPLPAKITLRAYQRGSQVIIEASDDGRGIDIEGVKKEAVARGLVTKEKIDEMADEQVMQLIFAPGFTTKKDVSELSGRGVGLDVVRESVARLKGIAEVSSKPGEGSTFTIKVPLTLAITESLLVSAGSEMFALPLDTIETTLRISPEQVNTVETKEAITVRGHIIPLLRLNDLFGLAAKGIVERKFSPVVVVRSVEKKLGLMVDQLIGRQEIVNKVMGEPLRNIRDIAGATILGNGRIILVLDIPSIIGSAEGVVIRRPMQAEAFAKPAKKRKKSILLVEDVLSTAMLEKNILESAGFSVVIARDGEEALKTASQEKFDLVITDILMPKMDGFELTQRLKKDKIYKDTPVIIVTTRDSDVDKKRGLDAGAEAYILKSEFTSEGLLEIIERLIG